MILIGLGILFLTTETCGDSSCRTCFENAGCVLKTLPEMTSCSSQCDGWQNKITIACCPSTYYWSHCNDLEYNNYTYCYGSWPWWWPDLGGNTGQQIIDIIHRYRPICNDAYSSDWYLERVKCGLNPCRNNGTCFSNGDQYTCNCAGTGFYGVNCETNECKPIPTDIVFVLDSSTSLTEKEFNKQLQFVSTFIDNIEIGPDDFRVGVVTFSTAARTEFGFNEYLTNSTIKSAIGQIKFRGGVTFTHLGLSSAEALFNGESMTNNASMTRKKYVIVLTDGMSNDQKQTKETAELLKNRVHKVITIGIGHEVSHKELWTISSPPDDTNSAYVFSVDDFNSLHTILKELVQLTCDKCDTSSFSDVMFLIDTSSYIPDTEFQIALSSITDISKHLKIIDSTNGTNVGIVTYDTYKGNIALPLNNSMEKNDILQLIQILTRKEATCETDGCHMGSINSTMSFFHEALRNLRKGSRKFLVILSNGKCEKEENSLGNLVDLFNRLYDMNKYVIGLGDDVNMGRLLALVTDPNQVFLLPDDSVFTHLDILQAAFTYIECKLHK